MDAGGNILIHHTRNTAQKQWAETQVLTLSGVARVFNTKRQLLQALGDFPRAWSILLEFIENAALSKNNEVSIAALKSFQEILFLSKNQNDKLSTEDREIWAVAWKIWLKIGTEITVPVLESDMNNDEFYFPSQTFLTALVQIFPSVFQHIKSNFSLEDLKQLGVVLTNAVSVPVYGETTPYIITTSSDVSLTPLHDGVLHTMEQLQKEALTRNNSKMIPEIFKRLLIFAKFTCTPPNYGRLVDSKHNKISDWVTMNYIPFGEKAMTMTVRLYEKTAENPEVINSTVLHGIISTLHKPLGLKYNCFANSIWKLAANSLISVLKTGLKIARIHSNQFASMWPELAGTLNDFLFPNMCTPTDKGLDEAVSDEATDCQLIELLRTDVLPYSSQIPKDFIMQVVVLLNKGSIHSATNVKTENDSEFTLREEFAKTCFETLLQFSLIDGESKALVVNGDDLAGQLAVTSLLQRFQEVLAKYIEDEKLSGKCPLPRLVPFLFVITVYLIS